MILPKVDVFCVKLASPRGPRPDNVTFLEQLVIRSHLTFDSEIIETTFGNPCKSKCR